MSLKAEILAALNFESFYRQELGELGAIRGDEITVLCPFHDDRNTPNLSINLSTGLYNCFACGAGGDVFAFYQKKHGCDFKEALAELARKAGVEPQSAKKDAEFLSLSLEEFSRAKGLEIDFLKTNHVSQYRFRDGVLAVDFAYLAADGRENLAIRHRYANRGDKKFRWRTKDKVQIYGLWKLPKILAGGWCLLVEGETDALTGWRHGLPVLGVPGAKTWKRARASFGEDWEAFSRLKIYVWREPDAAGSYLVQSVAQDLPQVQVLAAPADCKDISLAHGRGEDVAALVAGLKKKAQPPPQPPRQTRDFTFSDLGNARRLVALHGGEMKYNYLAKKWYYWTGKRWHADDCGEVERRAKGTVAEIYLRAAAAKDLEDRQALGKWALRCEDNKMISAMIRLAQSEPGIPVVPLRFDAQPWLFNCDNGTIDLRTGQLRPHDPADLLTCLAPVVYDPDAPCKRWGQFLDQIMDLEQRPHFADEMVAFLQRALGYSLTGNCGEQCLFLLWGSGANGKSTLVNLMTRLLGDYSRNTPVETLLARNKGGEIPTDIARLDGPRFVTAKEIDRGRRLSESLVKELTGQDVISARFLYGEYFDFIPQFKLWISTNNKPVIRGTDNAIWRRINFIKFPVELAKEERDEDLPDKLWAEASGILAWLVRGCRLWQEEGLDPPPAVLEATDEYRSEMDVLHDFIQDRCLVLPTAYVVMSELYEAYCAHAEENGIKEKDQLKMRTFAMCLEERGFRKDKVGGGVRIRRGLMMRSSA